MFAAISPRSFTRGRSLSHNPADHLCQCYHPTAVCFPG